MERFSADGDLNEKKDGRGRRGQGRGRDGGGADSGGVLKSLRVSPGEAILRPRRCRGQSVVFPILPLPQITHDPKSSLVAIAAARPLISKMPFDVAVRVEQPEWRPRGPVTTRPGEKKWINYYDL